jgi:hypothetical protein
MPRDDMPAAAPRQPDGAEKCAHCGRPRDAHDAGAIVATHRFVASVKSPARCPICNHAAPSQWHLDTCPNRQERRQGRLADEAIRGLLDPFVACGLEHHCLGDELCPRWYNHGRSDPALKP